MVIAIEIIIDNPCKVRPPCFKLFCNPKFLWFLYGIAPSKFILSMLLFLASSDRGRSINPPDLLQKAFLPGRFGCKIISSGI